MVLMREVLNATINPSEAWIEGVLLARISRHESAASWEASC